MALFTSLFARGLGSMMTRSSMMTALAIDWPCFDHPSHSHRAIHSTPPPMDLRKFMDMSHHQGLEPESHGRAWRESELRQKGWEDLHAIWHLCALERNLLLTEMGWKRVPKSKQEQNMLNIPRGHTKETDTHRLRYDSILKTMRRIKGVMRERAQRELSPIARQEILAAIMAR